MGDRHVSSTEVAPVASDNAPQDSASRNCKIRKCHSEKCNNVRDEAGTQDVIDLENLSATIYTETSDEDDTSEGDVERTETRLPLATGLGSFCGKELPYRIFVMNYKSRNLNISRAESTLSHFSENYGGVISFTKIWTISPEAARKIFADCVSWRDNKTLN